MIFTGGKNWESEWFIEFGPSKSNVIRVTRRHTRFKFQYKLHGNDLETLDTTKYLEINLSHDVRWNDHVNETITNNWTFYAAISALVRPNPKNEHTKLLWDQFIVEYSATVWDPCIAKNIEQVEMIQISLLDTLELRWSDARLCMLYKQSNGLAT